VYQPGGLTTRTYESPTSSSGRTDIWRVGLTACDDYCLTGSGWGTFPTVYAETQASVPNAGVLVGEGNYQPHNVWLLLGVELGVAGLLLFGLALAVTWREASRLTQAHRGPPLAVLAGMLLGLGFLSSIEFKFFWMVLIYVALCRHVEDAERATQQRPASETTSITG
jgi:O-antigen ligase